MAYRVAVVCRKRGFDELRLKNGWWSYDVPDFNWKFIPVDDGQAVSKDKLKANGYDLIVWEDWCKPEFVGTAPIPIYAVIVDSNTSVRRRKMYVERARSADVLLIDQDKLTAFKDVGKPAFRWQYAVNENVFAPQPKQVDVAYHVSKTAARQALGDPLRDFCRTEGLSLTMGSGLTIRQLVERYAAARIVVHKTTHEQCRSHRFFDAPAAGACLLTDHVWTVDGDHLAPGVHFTEWRSRDHLLGQIAELLRSGQWEVIANAGRAHVLRWHTWRTRAEQLKGIIEATHE